MRVFFLYFYIMIFTEIENKILNQLELIKKCLSDFFRLRLLIYLIYLNINFFEIILLVNYQIKL